MSTKFIQLPTCNLAEFVSSAATSFDVSGFLYNDGITAVDPADIGDVCFATLEPKTAREELISFTIDSVTAAGVATITATRGLSQKSPYGTGGATFDHQNGSDFVISNNPGLFNRLAAKANDETITGSWQFPAPSNVNNPATKTYTDTALATKVGLTGDEEIAGEKTFTTAPKIPDSAAADEAVTRGELDAEEVKLTGDQTVAGVKTFSSSPIVPTATTGTQAINKAQAEAYVAANSGDIKASDSAYGTTKLDVAADTPSDPQALTATADRVGAVTALTANTEAGKFIFGGNGSDGALNITSGTTTLDLSVKTVWQYTSITIAAGATLTFSNGEVGTKVPVLKCQGDFINEGTITTEGKGASGGSGGAGKDTWSIGVAPDGADGTDANRYVDTTIPEGGNLGTGAEVTSTTANATGGVGGAASNKNATYFEIHPMNGGGGAGGGGGTVGNTGVTAGDGGAGGAGGLGLLIEVVGDFDNTGGTLNLNGANGANGQNSAGNGSSSTDIGTGGGGGGGAAGTLFVQYIGALVDEGTITVSGGAAGSGGTQTSKGGGGGTLYDGAGGGGGGGGATFITNGSAGSNESSGNGGAGGAGASGLVYIAKITS